jgi:hypothetical protein
MVTIPLCTRLKGPQVMPFHVYFQMISGQRLGKLHQLYHGGYVVINNKGHVKLEFWILKLREAFVSH